MTSRREFVKVAVAIGGTQALSACLQLSEEAETAEEPAFPRGSDPSERPERQHAWGEYIVRNARQNPVFPQHQVALFLDYVGDGPPTDAERRRVEEAFAALDRAYQWGTGGDASAAINSGLLFSVAYAPSYFDRFEADLPGSIDLPPPEDTLRELDDDPGKANPHDAVLHMGSDHAEIVLAAEEALFGELDRVNGVEVTADVTGIFERGERRAGVIGRGTVRDELDNEDIPKRSPLSMGYKSAFKDALPSEDKVTIEEGPFAGATTEHFSRVEIDLDSWYDVDEEGQVHRMFGADYTTEEVGEVGDALGGKSRITEERAAAAEEDARSEGVVGHTQKAARARDEDFEPRILRRGELLMTSPREDVGSVLNFGSLQEGIADFVETRKAMEDLDFHGDGEAPDLEDHHHGILGFIDVTDRGNFLMPPRSLRALPAPRP